MRLICLFLYTFFISLLIPIFFTSEHFLYFVPFIVICFYCCTLQETLWWALSAGLVVDCLSTETRLGIHALNYCLTTVILYSYRYHFFEDSLSTIPLMTLFFAFISSTLQIFFFYLSSHQWHFSWEWMKHDLFWMPLRDSFYAFVTFTLPSIFFFKRRWRWFTKRGKA